MGCSGVIDGGGDSDSGSATANGARGGGGGDTGCEGKDGGNASSRISSPSELWIASIFILSNYTLASSIGISEKIQNCQIMALYSNLTKCLDRQIF
jgi:hypothetical protein